MSAAVTLAEAADFLKTHDDYLILSHRRPDGDTVGSCAALCRALRAIGKSAWICPNPQFTPKHAPFLEGLLLQSQETGNGEQGNGDEGADLSTSPSASLKMTGGDEAVAAHNKCATTPAEEPGNTFNVQRSTFNRTIISCDVASRKMILFGMEDAEVALAIDHHGTNDGYAALTHTDETNAACGEIIAELLPLLGAEMTREIADALYVAISTDTGCFRYSNVTAHTFRCAAACAAAGADLYAINRVFFEVKRRPRLLLEAYLAENTEYFADGKVCVSEIPISLIEKLGLTEDDIDSISSFGRSIEGVEIAVTIREVEDGQGKVSVRTGPGFSAAAICARIGGGGHPAAAGANVPGGIPAARKAVLVSIGEELAL